MLIIPLYKSDGGPPLAYACSKCPETERSVTRTKIGIKRHLWRVHQIKEQKELFK